ncbi:hypothetical protein HBI80_128950 [Parastagonospora nodorum]|nr:hypothetical protein HBI80_128950 [Parastagonospora nodorum]
MYTQDRKAGSGGKPLARRGVKATGQVNRIREPKQRAEQQKITPVDRPNVASTMTLNVPQHAHAHGGHGIWELPLPNRSVRE